ncbi:FERM and PDZ domain-containing protein 1 isoform X1 [Phycodurus eques]|uniref:FERM and PDZ domain-containing protein 1 isoform X1 n=1 Tax=Phycodurus eques TaxID=693459 RepID=UPI002ACEA3B5|nr:FERM and PDZ domain-containing protein 1 isoform X1 [Phycodurus eques]
MDLQGRSRSPSRRTSRVEQVVGRWLRRSRELGSRSHSLSRDRVAIDGRPAESISTDQRNFPFRLNVLIQQDPKLKSHGLTLSSQTPILVQEVTQGGPADGRLVPGDQLVKINNVAVDDLTPEQATEIIRECQDSLSVTILRTMLGPKSSFITPEKRAKLKSNPVKVRFAEEVEVNGHSQGNSLLFLPNVLKVYLENGQTKAFKFEPSTTVKDIVMTLKEKLSLRNIEHFSLVLEQQYSVTKLLLLHDEEKIQQVVQKKESRDYRCLFRVCFIPKQPETLLQDDPTAFEYFYLQGVNDVLQERFAVEMRCNTALRLAALHIQERLASCGLSPKTNLKIVTKTWGIENFVSSTLLRNMREKDLMKAISFQLKKSQSQCDPKQRGLTVNQARINYLEELSDLKSYGGKSFSATMMLQDRESTVTLLVGARYGVSQVINHKLSILSTLTEFNSITRLELVPESDKVGLVKIYLQDIMPITLLLETVASKDMSCLIAGYCRVFIDPNINIFPWMDVPIKHRVSAEEGYVSRCGSDSDHSSDLDMEPLVTHVSCNAKRRPRVRPSSDTDARKRREAHARRNKHDSENRNNKTSNKRQKEEKDAEREKGDHLLECENEDKVLEEKEAPNVGQTDKDHVKLENETQESKLGCGVAEAHPSQSDSCHTDSRVVTSPSSDSLDLLEEDDLISCSSSSLNIIVSTQSHAQIYSTLELYPYTQTHAEANLLVPPPAHSHPLLHLTSCNSDDRGNRRSDDIVDPQHFEAVPTSLDTTSSYTEDDTTCFAELSRLVDLLPSPPEASEDEEDVEKDLRKMRNKLNDNKEDILRRICEVTKTSRKSSIRGRPQSPSLSSASSHSDFVFNFDQRDASCYYKICSNITPDSARSLSKPENDTQRGDKKKEEEQRQANELASAPILQPPPGYGDSSSDEEFFDARDGFTSPNDQTSGMEIKDNCTGMKVDFGRSLKLGEIRVSVGDANKDGKSEEERQQQEKEGGGKKGLCELRKRSRKRRSFMETDYTSRVSYPKPKTTSMQDRVLSIFNSNFLAEGSDAHTLSSEPEPLEPTDNPSLTVSSLTYSEGEPAQLESKPIPFNIGSIEETGDSLASGTRNRKQEMEMEPDTMESKSVTDHIKRVAPSIAVVRCRVDPDGKESADCRGDRPETGRDQEGLGDRKLEEDKEQSMAGNGPFTSHMFLPRVTEKKVPIPCSEDEIKAITLTSWLTELNNKGVHQIAPVQNSHAEDDMPEDDSALSSYSPPPPPPSSPLPPMPVCHKSQSDCLHCTGTSTKLSPPNSEEKQNEVHNPQLNLEITKNEDEATDMITLARTASDEVTDSMNSDVFDDDDDDELINDDIGKDADGHEWTTAITRSVGANSLAGTAQSEMRINCPNNSTTEPHLKSNGHPEYTHTINSITAKLGVATSVINHTFNSGAGMKTEVSNALCMTQTTHTPREGYSSPGGDSHSLQANTAMAHDLAKEPPLPTHFIFQSCSPSIMGRLSASTLRGKIQKLPLYLSRSQETLNKATRVNDAQSPIRESEANIDISHIVKNIHDVTEITETMTELVESDDSDTTLTGSEVECDFFVETTSAKNSSLVSEVKETPEKILVDHETTSLPLQAEPQPQHTNRLLPDPNNTLGPITEPPVSMLSSLRRNSTGLTMDTPGPIIVPPESKMGDTMLVESIPGYKLSTQSSPSLPPIVVTTQNLNGPGLHYHSQSQIAQRTSSDRPLMGLCRPAEQTMDSSHAPYSGCRVFTFWEEPSQVSSEVGTTLNLKSEIGCTSVLTSRCESAVEGLNMDTCGCPVVYNNCFSKEGSFDEDLTVYEFSCQGSGETQSSRLSLPLMTDPPSSSLLSPSSTHSPTYPHILLSSPASELSPLLSPVSDAQYLHNQTQKDTINRLGTQRYPEPPTGFQVLRADVDQLLFVLENINIDRSVAGQGGCHPRETCASHFTENKQVLQTETRRLTACCQKMVATDQSPEEMLNSLADSFRTLVELAGACIWFSSCDRCKGRNAEAVAGLQDVARSFRDFCLAAERAGRKHSCRDLSTKLLAKQCTALTASVFCLTQIFRTLTAL